MTAPANNNGITIDSRLATFVADRQKKMDDSLNETVSNTIRRIMDSIYPFLKKDKWDVTFDDAPEEDVQAIVSERLRENGLTWYKAPDGYSGAQFSSRKYQTIFIVTLLKSEKK